MRITLLLATLLTAMAAQAQVTKLLMYCDYYTPGNLNDIYIDVYVDYDSSTKTFSNVEAGIVKSETDKYPDYLWSLTTSYTAESATATVTIEKDLDYLAFDLPAVPTKEATPTFAIPTDAAGVVTDFNVQVTGVLNGASLNETFLCYDPTTKEQQEK